MTARLTAQIGDARRQRGVSAVAPVRPVANIITAVARNPVSGIVQKHGHVRNSQANLPWEKSMPFAKTSSYPRSRSQIEPARHINRRPDVDADLAPVIPLLRNGAPTRPATLTISARIAKAGATLSNFAENVLPNLLLAIVSWVVRETLDGCAAYAEALYGVPFSELAEPVPADVPQLATPHRLRLVTIHARDDFESRLESRGLPIMPARVEAKALAWPGSLPANLPVKKRSLFSRWRTAISIFIVASGARIRLARERRQALAELRAMDDRSLRDIGLTAGEIEYIVWRDVGRE